MPLHRCWPHHSLRANIHPHLHLLIILLFVASCSIVKGVTKEHQAVQLSVNEKNRCYNFTFGNPNKQEIYTPGYPANYPNNSDCECLLKAPPGMIIEIDFLDQFQMEESVNCSHDVLEIRDGCGGHSPVLQRLCGMKFPDKLRSVGEYMWLRFVSDESLEYAGFRAVYTFHEGSLDRSPVSDCCWYEENDYEGIVGTANISSEYRNYTLDKGLPLSCVWMINVTANHETSLIFWNFVLDTPNDCQKNSLSIYHDHLLPANLKFTLCGTSAKNFSHNSSITYLHLRAEAHHLDSQFTLHYTAYRTLKADSVCNSVTEFDCRDTTCININLRCNNRVNCKYKTDEDGCLDQLQQSILEKEDVMIILIIGIALLFSICISMTVSCYRQWREIQKRRQELAARRSVPSGMDRIDSLKPEGLTNLSVVFAEEPDDDGCYVPEVDLSMFHKRSNGGNAILFDQETSLFDKLPPPRDKRQESIRSTSSTPPLVHLSTVATIDSCQLNNRTSALNTFLNEEEEEAQDIFPPPPTRLQDLPDKRRTYRPDSKTIQRPRSFDAVKSAPDVIGRH